MYEYLFTKTPLFFFTQSFWRDEAFSYLLSLHSIPDIITLTVKDFNPPLYYILLHYWIKLFGSSIIALRSLSLLFFILTIYVVFDILTQINKFSYKKSVFYLFLFIFNPLLNYYAFEARMYSMMGFLATLSYYAFYKQKKRLYIISTVLGLYTHYFMLLVLLSQGIWLLWLRFKEKESRSISLKLLITPFLLFLPWLFYLITQVKNNGKFWISKPALNDVFYILGFLYTGYEKDFGKYFHGRVGYTNLTAAITAILFLIVISGFVYIYKKRKKSLPLFFLYTFWALIPAILVFIAAYFRSYYLPRYLLFCTVGLLLLVIYILELLPGKLKYIFILLLFYLTFQYQKLNIKYRKKYSFNTNIREIQALARPEDLIYVSDERDYHVAQYYFGTDKVYIYGKRYSAIPSYVGKILIPEKDLVSTYPPFPRKAFVIKHNSGYEIKTDL